MAHNKWKRESDKKWKGGVCFLSFTFSSAVISPSWPSPEQDSEARGDSSSTWGSFPPAGGLPRLSTRSTKACSCECRACSLLVRAPTRGRSARSDSSEICKEITEFITQTVNWLREVLRLIHDGLVVGLITEVAEQSVQADVRKQKTKHLSLESSSFVHFFCYQTQPKR